MKASLAAVARALGGDVVGHQILAPGPGHSPKDRSMSVRLSAVAPEGFVVNSFGKSDPLECRDYIRARLGWARPEFNSTKSAQVEITPAVPTADENAKIGRARTIWAGSVDPVGTIVERYLASRGLELPWEARGEAIRFHSACPWRDEASGSTIRVPAMVSAMRSIATGEITGVHRTRLSPDGQKVDRRMLGKASGAAVMLTPYSAVGAGLGIGEGVESCLAGMQMGWSPAWALGSAGAIGAFPLLSGLQSLFVFCETGDGGANERAVSVVGQRYYADGREVILVEPKCVGDLNDAVRSAA